MNAVLLAAGKGSRISKNIPNIPKSTLDVGGKPLIERTVGMMIEKGIRVTVVVGYEHIRIEELLKDYDVNIVYNPFFDVTNSIGSLWMARKYLTDDDVILANADVFWSETLLDYLLSKKQDAVMLADRSRVDEGDYFFATKNGKLVNYGKELKRDERDCEYVGIAKLSRQFVPTFVERLDEMVSNQQHDCWWENVLYSLAWKQEINVADVEGRFWAEIDYIEDYYRILDYVKRKEGGKETA